MKWQQFLLETMKKKRVTQKYLAHELGISQAAVSKYFSGKSTPNIDVFFYILDLLGVEEVVINKNGDVRLIAKSDMKIKKRYIF